MKFFFFQDFVQPQHVPKVIMLICVFIFETEGLDEGSWIKVLNLTLGGKIPGSGVWMVYHGIHGCDIKL